MQDNPIIDRSPAGTKKLLERLNMRNTRTSPAGCDAIPGFSAALKQVMQTLDYSGRMPGKTARALLQALNGARGDLMPGAVLEPEKYLGPFESLGPNAQDAIVEAVVSNDRWSMRGYEVGDWQILLARLFTKLGRKCAEHDLNRMSAIARILALASKSGPSFLMQALYRIHLSWRGRLPLQPTLAALLNMIGIDPRNLAVCYARHIPQAAAYRGYYHDVHRHNTYGVVLGLDLLPSGAGFWYIESNLDFGMSRTRSALYDRDPIVKNLVEFAAENGFRNLIILYNTSSYMNEGMARQYEEEALARKLRLTIVEDAYLPSRSGYLQSYGVPSFDSHDTLVARTKYYHTSLDYLFQHKHASIRALTVYKQRTSDPALLVPRISAEPVLGDVGPEDPFPDLVFKLPERDEGKGVIFLKAGSQGHATTILQDAVRRNRPRGFVDRLYSRMEDRNGLCQQYIQSPLLTGRMLYKIRAHVLISPIGVKFLSAHRVIGRHAVPEYLPLGVVRDPRPYLVNLSTSSHYELIPPDEEPAVVAAALAVARGLAWAATYGFEDSPGGNL